MPMNPRIEAGGYYAVVARGTKLPTAEVYRWTVRDPLPPIPIPLRAPDADVRIDLAPLVSRVYTLGRYARTLRRDQPLPDNASLSPDDRARGLSRARVARPDDPYCDRDPDSGGLDLMPDLPIVLRPQNSPNRMAGTRRGLTGIRLPVPSREFPVRGHLIDEEPTDGRSRSRDSDREALP